MKQKVLVTVYGSLGNNASIHIPGRNSPASAIQKDTLQCIIEDLRFAGKLLLEGHSSDAKEEIDSVVDRLSEIYECLSLETREDFP